MKAIWSRFSSVRITLKLISGLILLINLWIVSWLFLKVGFPITIGIQVCLYIITVLACIALPLSLPYIIKTICHTFPLRLAVIMLCLYAAFSLTGNYLFIYPLDMHVTSQSLLLFLATLVWVAPVCFCIISLLFYVPSIIRPYLKKNEFRGHSSHSKMILFVMTVSVIMAVELVYLYAFNPAITSYDSLRVIEQAKGLLPLTNWHPPFYTILVRGLLSICDSPTFIVLIQCFYFALVWASLMQLLFESGVQGWVCIVITLLFTAMPNNGLQLISLWKDIPYGTTLLWLTILFAKLIMFPKDCYSKIWFLLQWIVSLFLLAVLRQNGIIVSCLAAVAILLVMRFNRRAILIVSVSALCIFMITVPLYSVLEVQPGRYGGKFIGLSQDILGVYFAGGNMPDGIQPLIDTLIAVDDYRYTPYYAFSSYSLQVSMGEFLLFYVKTFISNPVTMLRVILCRVDCVWNIMDGRDAFLNAAMYSDTIDYHEVWAAMYPARVPNSMTGFALSAIARTINVDFKWFVWRCGAYTFLSITCCIVAFAKKNGRFCLTLIPWVGQFLSLLLSTGWADYRYFWPLYLCSVAFILFFLIANGQERNTGIQLSGKKMLGWAAK